VICQDCAAAADLAEAEREGLPATDVPAVLLGAGGHDRCVARNLGRRRESQDCTCQHRAVSGG